MTAAPTRFEIRAGSDAHMLPRLLNYFAQRGLTPSFVHAEVIGAMMIVVIEQALEPDHASIIAEKMRSSVLVEEIVLSAISRVECDTQAASLLTSKTAFGCRATVTA